MKKNCSNGSLAALWVLLLALAPVPATVRGDTQFDWYGDLRLRLEQDWDSKRSNGTERDDRLRARIRLRAGIKFTAANRWEFGARARTGSNDSQQSPHITFKDFDDNPRGDEDVNLDKWYVKYKGDNYWIMAGRNSYPFWKQNELFWEDDVTPAGGAFSIGKRVQFTAGYFTLPAGMRNFFGDMYGAQLKYSNDSGMTLALEYLDLQGDADDEAASVLLLRGNGGRDYALLQAHAQWNYTGGERLLRLGLDYSHNLEDYDDPSDSFAFANQDETDGWVASVALGGTGKKGDWLLAYYYARIEALAVNNSFSQDDWVRWGNATQTRASDMKGHEFRAAYRWTPKLTVVGRVYLADAITSVEDGKRARIDFNWKF